MRGVGEGVAGASPLLLRRPLSRGSSNARAVTGALPKEVPQPLDPGNRFRDNFSVLGDGPVRVEAAAA